MGQTKLNETTFIAGRTVLCYGWDVRFRDGKLHSARHTGCEYWLGHSSVMCLYENGDTFVVLSNSVQGSVGWSSIISRELQKRLQP